MGRICAEMQRMYADIYRVLVKLDWHHVQTLQFINTKSIWYLVIVVHAN